jgi:hypothetical protein
VVSDAEPATHRYYRAMHGSWRGALDLRVTDREAFGRLPWLERARVRTLLATLSVATIRVDTTLDWATSGPAGLALHTTRMSVAGVPLFRSFEELHLGPDGRSVRIAGWRSFPPLFAREPQAGEARVEQDALGAAYDFPWFGGARLAQTTRVVADGLRIVQRSDWSRGEFVLARWSDEVVP